MKHPNTIFPTILLALGFFALLPLKAFGVVPAPGGAYPGLNTAEGENALFSLTTGLWNTALGGHTLFSNTSGRANTAVGLNALDQNVGGNSNTAAGVNALFSNNNGAENCALGMYSLFVNTSGTDNSAIGWAAMASNTTGDNNTAAGVQALFHNVTGIGNTALGFNAGFNLTGDDNIDIGYFVEGLAGESNTVRIGSNLPQGFESNCYIGGIFDSEVGPDSFLIGVNADNKVGDFFLSGSASKIRIMDVIHDHKKVAELEATVAALAAQLKEQAAQIQKVNAQVEMNRPATKVALDTP